MEIERDLHKEIAAIEKSELAPAEKEAALAMARQTAELKAQAQQRAQARSLEQAQADNAVGQAELHGSKRAIRQAKVDQFFAMKRAEFEDQGFGADQATQLANDATDTFREQLKREGHVIGGHAGAADPSRNKGAIDTSNIFRRPLDLGPTRPANAPGTEGGTGDDRQPDIAGGNRAGGDSAKSAADGLAKASENTENAARTMAVAAASLISLNAVLNSLGGGLGDLGTAVANLQNEVARLNSEHS